MATKTPKAAKLAARTPKAELPCNKPGCEEPRWVLGSGAVLSTCRTHELERGKEKAARRRAAKAEPGQEGRRPEGPAGQEGGEGRHPPHQAQVPRRGPGGPYGLPPGRAPGQ